MQDVDTIVSKDGQKRVVFCLNADSTYGFRHERWSEEPLEHCWVPSAWPDSRCDSLEEAKREAAGRVGWLTKEKDG